MTNKIAISAALLSFLCVPAFADQGQQGTAQTTQPAPAYQPQPQQPMQQGYMLSGPLHSGPLQGGPLTRNTTDGPVWLNGPIHGTPIQGDPAAENQMQQESPSQFQHGFHPPQFPFGPQAWFHPNVPANQMNQNQSGPAQQAPAQQ